MSRKKQKGANSKAVRLTSTELEMMQIIWRHDSCTVATVRQELLPERDLAYTSVSTIVRILEKKGFVTSTREGRGYVYSASIEKKEYQEQALNFLVCDVFDRTPTLLVQRLVDSDVLTKEELQEFQDLLRSKAPGR